MFIEGLRTFFNGGPEVLDAKAELRRLAAKPHLSKRDQATYEKDQRVVRRDHLARDAKVAAASLISLGSLSALNLDYLLKVIGSLRYSPDSQTTIKPEQPPDNLSAIRREMADFEEKVSRRSLIDQDIIQLFHYTERLYREVFARPVVQSMIMVFGNGVWQQPNRIDWPMIENLPQNIQVNLQTNIPFSANYFGVVLGRTDNVDPKISQISAYRGLVFHSYVHTQIIRRQESGTANVLEGQLPLVEARGLKRVAQGGQGLVDVGQFFEEVNTQLIAEHLNNALVGDRIYQRMAESLLYQNSLPPIYAKGSEILKKLYDRLGISIEEVETFHYSSNPRALFDRIDAGSVRLGVNLPQPVSTLLINLSPRNLKSDAELKVLEELVSRLFL